ncbi:ferritin-like domain-containing protein, partial [Staphylococcus capitis]|uniref:ferritin-like domain-containing protein n=1 Tax=Staphylococcus capitis TaxID=29388 RepID=UPI0021B42972
FIAMPPYSHKQSYQLFPNFYIQQPKQEPFHPKKIYHYINHPGQHPVFHTIKAPKLQFSSILQTFKHPLQQQTHLTKRFYNLSDLAH